jgi:hypothetical protein
MTYASPAWEFEADTHLMKLEGLQNKVLLAIGNYPRRTPVRGLHMAFKLPYVYDYIQGGSNMTGIDYNKISPGHI